MFSYLHEPSTVFCVTLWVCPRNIIFFYNLAIYFQTVNMVKRIVACAFLEVLNGSMSCAEFLFIPEIIDMMHCPQYIWSEH
jgi:hypothetical protein